MNNDELNAFIARYAIQDKTKTAVLLTGEWGSGKSYYINYSLNNYLKEKGVKGIIVSLYGVDSISELSKQIYLRLRFPTFTKKSEVKEYFSIVGQNIINNALSLNGVNINVSDKQLKNLYKSANLENTLLIIEDFERSSIDVFMLLGFINGLVEYDGAKVLLVANEDEILRKNDKPSETEDFFAEKYKHIKEKTIGDTIQFKADTNETIRSILNEYPGEWIQILLRRNEVKRIADLLVSVCNCNFRLLKYAIQKYNDIFSRLYPNNAFDDTFCQTAFEGLLTVSEKFISSDIPAWEGTEFISTSLGSEKSPLFRFVYDYLRWKTINDENVVSAFEEYKNYLYFEKNATRENDEDLYILKEYYKHTEREVIAALKNIEKKLKEKEYIGVYAYEQLGYLALKAGNVVGYNPDVICLRLIDNAKIMCQKQHLSSADYIWGIYGGGTDDLEVQRKYKRFIKDLASVIEGQDELSNYSYDPEIIHEIYDKSAKNKYQFIVNHSFIGRFEASKLVAMLTYCSAEQIDDFRGILFVYYRDVAKNEYDEKDKRVLEQMLELLDERIEKENEWDKIQCLQINYLRSNLQDFIKKMN